MVLSKFAEMVRERSLIKEVQENRRKKNQSQ